MRHRLRALSSSFAQVNVKTALGILICLYFFGSWSWIHSALKMLGFFVAAWVAFAVYSNLVTENESHRLKYIRTQADKFGLFGKPCFNDPDALQGTPAAASSSSPPFFLAHPKTWQDYERVRALERIRPRPPQLLNPIISRKSFPSLGSEDYYNSAGNQMQINPASIRSYQKVVGDLITLVNRDFVESWFKQISVEPIFLNKVESTLYQIFLEITARVERLDMVQLIVNKVLPAFTNHVREFRRAERLFRAERLQRTNQSETNEESDYLLARCYKAGKLHPAIHPTQTSTKLLEQAYLRKLLRPVIPHLLPPNEADGRIMRILLREILVCKVLQPTMEALSEPDTWNSIFESAADKMMEQDP